MKIIRFVFIYLFEVILAGPYDKNENVTEDVKALLENQENDAIKNSNGSYFKYCKDEKNHYLWEKNEYIPYSEFKEKHGSYCYPSEGKVFKDFLYEYMYIENYSKDPFHGYNLKGCVQESYALKEQCTHYGRYFNLLSEYAFPVYNDHKKDPSVLTVDYNMNITIERLCERNNTLYTEYFRPYSFYLNDNYQRRSCPNLTIAENILEEYQGKVNDYDNYTFHKKTLTLINVTIEPRLDYYLFPRRIPEFPKAPYRGITFSLTVSDYMLKKFFTYKNSNDLPLHYFLFYPGGEYKDLVYESGLMGKVFDYTEDNKFDHPYQLVNCRYQVEDGFYYYSEEEQRYKRYRSNYKNFNSSCIDENCTQKIETWEDYLMHGEEVQVDYTYNYERHYLDTRCHTMWHGYLFVFSPEGLLKNGTYNLLVKNKPDNEDHPFRIRIKFFDYPKTITPQEFQVVYGIHPGNTYKYRSYNQTGIDEIVDGPPKHFYDKTNKTYYYAFFNKSYNDRFFYNPMNIDSRFYFLQNISMFYNQKSNRRFLRNDPSIGDVIEDNAFWQKTTCNLPQTATIQVDYHFFDVIGRMRKAGYYFIQNRYLFKIHLPFYYRSIGQNISLFRYQWGDEYKDEIPKVFVRPTILSGKGSDPCEDNRESISRYECQTEFNYEEHIKNESRLIYINHTIESNVIIIPWEEIERIGNLTGESKLVLNVENVMAPPFDHYLNGLWAELVDKRSSKYIFKTKTDGDEQQMANTFEPDPYRDFYLSCQIPDNLTSGDDIIMQVKQYGPFMTTNIWVYLDIYKHGFKKLFPPRFNTIFQFNSDIYVTDKTVVYAYPTFLRGTGKHKLKSGIENDYIKSTVKNIKNKKFFDENLVLNDTIDIIKNKINLSEIKTNYITGNLDNYYNESYYAECDENNNEDSEKGCKLTKFHRELAFYFFDLKMKFTLNQTKPIEVLIYYVRYLSHRAKEQLYNNLHR